MEISYIPMLTPHRYTLRHGDNHVGHRFWTYPSAESRVYGDRSVFVRDYPHGIQYGPPPSETLKTLIAAGAPWYAVLDKFVEEYPQWEEVLTWAPKPTEVA